MDQNTNHDPSYSPTNRDRVGSGAGEMPSRPLTPLITAKEKTQLLFEEPTIPKWTSKSQSVRSYEGESPMTRMSAMEIAERDLKRRQIQDARLKIHIRRFRFTVRVLDLACKYSHFQKPSDMQRGDYRAAGGKSLSYVPCRIDVAISNI